jgi:hypothetical protein
MITVLCLVVTACKQGCWGGVGLLEVQSLELFAVEQHACLRGIRQL